MMSLIVRLSGAGWPVTMESLAGVTALYPPARGGHTPSSSTPETASRIIQEVGGTKEHTRVINPTLIAHFEFSSKSSATAPSMKFSSKF